MIYITIITSSRIFLFLRKNIISWKPDVQTLQSLKNFDMEFFVGSVYRDKIDAIFSLLNFFLNFTLASRLSILLF